MSRQCTTFLALLLALTIFGCDDGGGDDPIDTANDVTIAPDTTADADATADTQSPDADASTDTSTDTTADMVPIGGSCAEGIALVMGNEAGVNGVLNPPGDADFYLIEVATGQFFTLATTANPDDIDGGIDTVISLFTADGSTLLASADDSIPRISTDSELFYHSLSDQTLCVKVEEWSTWAQQAPIGSPSYTYNVMGYVLSDSSAATSRDAEPNNEETAAQAGAYAALSNADFNYTYGLLDPVSDVDVFAFTLPAGAVNLAVVAQPSGVGGPGLEGHGSSLVLGVVRITDTAGNDIANVDFSSGAHLSVPMVAGTKFLLWIQRAAGSAAGGNDFYFLKNVAYHSARGLELEQGNHSNDDLTSSESLVFVDTSAYLLGNIEPIDDIDTHSFNALAGQSYVLACGAARNGSGLDGTTFSLLDSTGVVLQTETETPDADIYWSDTGSDPSMGAVSIPADGKYYLQISATGQRAGVSSTYYRCGLHLDL